MWSRHSRRSVPTNRSAYEFARGDRTGVLITRTVFPEKTALNVAVNLLSRSRIRNLKPLAEIHQEIAGLLGGPGPGWMRGNAQDMDPPGPDLHNEQHVHAPEHDGVDMQEIAGKDSRCLRGQKLTPGRRSPPRRRSKTGRGHDPADRPLPQPAPKAEQFALDAPVSPARVLPRKPFHQGTHLGRHSRSTRSARIGPCLLDQAAVRGQHRACRHDPVQLQVPRQHHGKGGEHRTVSPVRPRARYLPAQDRDLMAEEQDLRILGGVNAR